MARPNSTIRHSAAEFLDSTRVTKGRERYVPPGGHGHHAWGGLAWVPGNGATRSTGNMAACTGATTWKVHLPPRATPDAPCFDTAEIYGRGESERILGPLARASRGTVVATKYWPSPRRLRATSVDEAIDRSLARLGVDSIDLYQIHWPMGLIPQKRLAAALARAVRGPAHPRGGREQLHGPRHAFGCTAAWPTLACRWRRTKVEYSLLRRAPETNGVLEACQELNVTLLAYSPLAQGMLTGNYHFNSRPGDGRRWSPRFRGQGFRSLKAPFVRRAAQSGRTA